MGHAARSKPFIFRDLVMQSGRKSISTRPLFFRFDKMISSKRHTDIDRFGL